MARELKHALLERLVHYYHFLGERLDEGHDATVTSMRIASLLRTDDTLVRKDLAAIGVRGLPRVGFSSAEVLGAIRDLLGFDEAFRAVIIGAGRLGGAMASYAGFARYGLDIVALFDTDPAKIGSRSAGHIVQPFENLAEVVSRQDVSMAILTVPAAVAQEVADAAVSAGVRAIWNFATTSLHVPEDVFVRHEHISVGLAELSYHLKHRSGRGKG